MADNSFLRVGCGVAGHLCNSGYIGSFQMILSNDEFDIIKKTLDYYLPGEKNHFCSIYNSENDFDLSKYQDHIYFTLIELQRIFERARIE